MTRQEFSQSIDVLKKVFGDKAYPEERVTTLYNSFATVSFGVWLKAIPHAINNNRFAPLEKELAESLTSVFLETGSKNSLKPNLDDFSGCDRCDHVGWFYIKTNQPDPIQKRVLTGVAACSCPKGAFLVKANKLQAWEDFVNKHLFTIYPHNSPHVFNDKK